MTTTDIEKILEGGTIPPDSGISKNEDGTFTIVVDPPVPALNVFNVTYGTAGAVDSYQWQLSATVDSTGGIQVTSWTTATKFVNSGQFAGNAELVQLASQLKEISQRMSVLMLPYDIANPPMILPPTTLPELAPPSTKPGESGVPSPVAPVASSVPSPDVSGQPSAKKSSVKKS